VSEFSPLTEREFASPLQLERLLSELQIEYLGVDDQRLYVIFAETVLEVCVRSGTVETAQTLTIAIVEESKRSDTDPETIVANFLQRLEDAATPE